jgi:beta-lactamase superfamily II metal-dependent hydrolase
MRFLIQHYKHTGSALTNSLKAHRITVHSSHRAGEIVTASDGRKYEVQNNHSLKRVQ